METVTLLFKDHAHGHGDGDARTLVGRFGSLISEASVSLLAHVLGSFQKRGALIGSP